jgi:hypothetical protein
MKTELTIEDLKARLAKAESNYANCGCKIYLEEMEALKARIAYLEKQK